jgi:tape measure domain-containing protein
MSTLNFDAIWRDRGVAKGLQGISKNADAAGQKMQGVNRTSSQAGKGFGFAAKGAAAVGVGLATAATAALGYGLKVAAGNEQAKIGFTTMLGSGKKAEAFLKDLEAFAAKTPFEFPELQKAASSLISVGVNSNKVIPIMRTLGNVTSGMGTGAEGVERATVALQQMQSAGRITAEDLNQLRDAGIPLKTVMQAISAETGTSTKKLFEMSRTGKLGRKELDALMASLESGKGFEKFNGLMDAQSKSLTGMLSTLKDTFGMGMAKAIEPALPFLKGAIGAVTKTLGNFFAWTATHQEEVVDGLVAVGNGVLGVSKTFLQLESSALRALASIADGVASILEGLDKLPGMGDMRGTIDAMREFGRSARVGADSIDANLIPKIDEAHERWNKFGKDQKTKAALRDANQVITNAVQKTSDALKKNGKTVDENTEKGKRNRSALRNLAESQVAYRDKLSKTGAKTRDVDRYTEEARKTFIRTAVRMGASKREAEKLADKYGLLDRRINGLNDKKITIKFGAGSYSIGGVKYRVNLTSPSSVGRSATGGMIRGPGNGTSDSILRWLSNGEFVVNAKATAQNRQLLEAINAPGKTPHPPASGMRAGGVVSLNNVGPGGAMYAPAQAAKYRDAIAQAIGKDVGARAAKKISAWQNSMMMGGPAGSAIASGGWASIYRILRAAGARRFTTYAGHDQGASRSRDITPPSARIAETARRLSSIWYVIYNRRIASVTYGRRWRPYTRSNPHTDHVHVTLRPGVRADKGGLLASGGLAANMSGQSERILSPAQTKTFDRMVRVMDRSGGVSTTIIVNAPGGFIGSQDQFKRMLVDMNRRGELQVIKR